MLKILPKFRNLSIQTHRTPYLQVRYIPLKVAIEKSLLFEEHCVDILSTLILPWIFWIEIARSFYNLIIWTQLDFQTRFLPKILPWVLSLKSQSLVFYFCCTILLKIVTFHPFSGIPINQNWQKVLLVLTCLDNQSHISSGIPSSFPLQRVNRLLFTQSRPFIPKNHEGCLLHWASSPDWPNVAKVLLVLKYFDIPARPSQK